MGSIGDGVGLKIMSKTIGVIAEDSSDVEVAKAILRKYLAPSSFQIKRFVGKGCGPIRRKTCGWAKVLWRRGCRYLILLHDLDESDEAILRSELELTLKKVSFKQYIVVIPVKEIEAWLLSDTEALVETFGMSKKPKVDRRTELINEPKEYLRDVIWKSAQVRYLPTVHNEKIAINCKKSELRRCKSFSIFDRYIQEQLV